MPRISDLGLRADTAAGWAAAEVGGSATSAGENVWIDNDLVKCDGVTKVNDLPRAGSGTYATKGEAGVTSSYVDQLIAQASPPLASDTPALTISGPGGPNPIPSGVNYTFDTASVTRIGCYPVTVNQFGTDYQQNQVSGETGAGAKPWAVEFVTSSADIVMPFRAATAGPRFWVFADGKPVTAQAVVYTQNVSPGSLSYLRILFSSTALRRIRIYMQYADFGGLSVLSGQTATAASVATTKKAAFLGDSWFAGTGTSVWPHTIGAVIARTMGWEFFDCGIGATGYTAGSGLTYGGATRTTPLYAVTPDYVIIGGSINDNGAAPASVQAAATALYGAIGTNLPSAKLFVVGPQPVPSDYVSSATLLANRDAVRTAALAAGNVLGFIDPIAGQWLTGSGSVAAPAGNGNKDYFVAADALHPTRAGGYRYARLITEDIIRLLDKAGLLV